MTTKDDVKKHILQIIIDKQGLKATELIAEMTVGIINNFDIPSIIDELVFENAIVEIEYIIPTINYRIKSYLLPSNTKISVNTTNRDVSTFIKDRKFVYTVIATKYKQLQE